MILETMRDRATRQCSGRFCNAPGWFLDHRIAVPSFAPAPRVIGLCRQCSRLWCSDCAATTPHEERSVFACRNCGNPLGRGEVDELSATCAGDDPAPGGSELFPEELLAGLFHDLADNGFIRTDGIHWANDLQAEGRHDEALAVLLAEEASCRAANFTAGIGYCLQEQTSSLVQMERFDEALERSHQAEEVLATLANTRLLAVTLFSRYFALQGGGADPVAQISVLDQLESIPGLSGDVLEQCLAAKVSLFFERNDFTGIIRTLLRCHDGEKKLRQLFDMLAAKRPLPAVHPPGPRPEPFDEREIHRFAATHHVWGCPNGCRLPGMTGWVGIPKGSVTSAPCFVCGAQLNCIDRYSAMHASVPDRAGPSYLSTEKLPETMRIAGVIFNFSLVLRDSLHADAEVVEQIALERWRCDCAGSGTLLATTLNLATRELQERDEHECAAGLLREAIMAGSGDSACNAATFASLRNNLGLSLACLGNFKEAEEELISATKLDPFPNPYYWLAKTYRSRGADGDQELEADAWRSYLERNPASIPRKNEAMRRLAEMEGRVYVAPQDEEPPSPAPQNQFSALMSAFEKLFGVSLEEKDEIEELRKTALESRETGVIADELRALRELGELLLGAGRWDEAVEATSRAAALANDQGDRHAECRILATSARALDALGRVDEARKAHAGRASSAEQIGDAAGLVGVLMDHARAEIMWREPSTAVPLYQRATEIASEAQLHGELTDALSGLAGAHRAAGDVRAASEVFEILAKRYRLFQNSRGLADTRLSQGLLCEESCQNEKAVLYFEEAMQLARDAEQDDLLIAASCRRGRHFDVKRDWIPAFNALEEAADLTIHKINCRKIAVKHGQDAGCDDSVATLKGILAQMDDINRQMAAIDTQITAANTGNRVLVLRRKATECLNSHEGLREELAASLRTHADLLLRLDPASERETRKLVAEAEVLESRRSAKLPVADPGSPDRDPAGRSEARGSFADVLGPEQLEALQRLPYPLEAFEFVFHDGLAAAQSRFDQDRSSPGRDPGAGPTHVTGQYLCWTLLSLAKERFGAGARAALSGWNIKSTKDFGAIVFALVDTGLMAATPDDRIEDFLDVFRFEDELE